MPYLSTAASLHHEIAERLGSMAFLMAVWQEPDIRQATALRLPGLTDLVTRWPLNRLTWTPLDFELPSQAMAVSFPL